MSAVSLEHATSERATMQAVRPRSGATPLLFFFLLLSSSSSPPNAGARRSLEMRPLCSGERAPIGLLRLVGFRNGETTRGRYVSLRCGEDEPRRCWSAAQLLSVAPPPALPVLLSRSNQWVCLQREEGRDVPLSGQEIK